MCRSLGIQIEAQHLNSNPSHLKIHPKITLRYKYQAILAELLKRYEKIVIGEIYLSQGTLFQSFSYSGGSLARLDC